MFGEHAAFILPSYIITFVVLSVMTLIIMMNYRSRKNELSRLEGEQDKSENE